MKKRGKKKILKWIIGVAIGGFVSVAAIHPVNASTVPETVDINTQKFCPDIPGLPKDIKAVPGFRHKLHAEEYLKGNAKYSTHPYTDEFTCSACHLQARPGKDLEHSAVCKGLEKTIEDVGGAKKFKNFFHKTCKQCHKGMKKAGLKTGPTSCKGCHSKH